MLLWCVTHTLTGRADDLLFRYEGNVLPYSVDGGWNQGNPCENGCSESVDDGYFELRWDVATDFALYLHWIAQPPTPAPTTLWVEWRFASNHPFINNDLCDGDFLVDYKSIVDELLMFGDSVISFEGGDVLRHLPLDEFRTFRFESLDGVSYCFFVDGKRFTCGVGSGEDDFHSLRFSGNGGCSLALLPTINRWDYIRYGTIGYGESIVNTDPPGPPTGGFLDARADARPDRFTVTYDQPNYVYVDEIAVEVSEPRAQARGPSSAPRVTGLAPGAPTTFVIPVVTATRRQDNGRPETVEIVLDRPIPYNATTRFIFNDGTIEQSVELTYAPGDTDGDGDADLADFAALQNCFGEPTALGVCASLDRDGDAEITDTDFAAFLSAFGGR